MSQYTPYYYGYYINETANNVILVEELLSDTVLMNAVDHIDLWTAEIINLAIDGLAQIQSISYDNPLLLTDSFWQATRTSTTEMQQSSELWQALADFIYRTYPDMVSSEDYQFHTNLIQNIANWHKALAKLPVSLIQNDFNPRNITFRKNNSILCLCTYDWERTEVNVPQHDLAEFLVFTLSERISDQEVLNYIEKNRNLLMHLTQKNIDRSSWLLGFCYSLYDLHLNRIPFLLMFNKVFPSQFAARLYSNLKRLLKVVPL